MFKTLLFRVLHPKQCPVTSLITSKEIYGRYEKESPGDSHFSIGPFSTCIHPSIHPGIIWIVFLFLLLRYLRGGEVYIPIDLSRCLMNSLLTTTEFSSISNFLRSIPLLVLSFLFIIIIVEILGNTVTIPKKRQAR